MVGSTARACCISKASTSMNKDFSSCKKWAMYTSISTSWKSLIWYTCHQRLSLAENWASAVMSGPSEFCSFSVCHLNSMWRQSRATWKTWSIPSSKSKELPCWVLPITNQKDQTTKILATMETITRSAQAKGLWNSQWQTFKTTGSIWNRQCNHRQKKTRRSQNTGWTFTIQATSTATWT